MKKFILLLFALSALLPGTSLAENYSCRDNKGQLHVADNLMSLPAECRHQADTREENTPGKVNYVPPVPLDPQTTNDFNQAVIQEQQKATQRQREADILVIRSERIADSYENAVISRKAALRSKQYGFRNTIVQADQTIQQARQDKQTLLDELKNAALSKEQSVEIERQLSRIQD